MSSRLKKAISSWWLKRYIEYHTEPFSFFTGKIERGECFSIARYGDGEWAALLGKSGQNCDGHQYFPEMGERLRATLLNPRPYLYGLQRAAMRTMGFQISRFVKKHALTIPWYYSDVFHYANIDGELNPLLRQMRIRPSVIVGPAFLSVLSQRAFPVAGFIEVPEKNCFLEIGRIVREIREFSRKRRGVIYSFSASMATNIMIHDLYDELGADNWLLDLGSVWDVYAGVKSRWCFKDRDWQPIIQKNLAD